MPQVRSLAGSRLCSVPTRSMRTRICPDLALRTSRRRPWSPRLNRPTKSYRPCSRLQSAVHGLVPLSPTSFIGSTTGRHLRASCWDFLMSAEIRSGCPWHGKRPQARGWFVLHPSRSTRRRVLTSVCSRERTVASLQLAFAQQAEKFCRLANKNLIAMDPKEEEASRQREASVPKPERTWRQTPTKGCDDLRTTKKQSLVKINAVSQSAKWGALIFPHLRGCTVRILMR